MSESTTARSSCYDTYAGNPAENYEHYFVPAIGAPSAQPVLATADLREGETVVDIGCGTGVVARLAADAVGPTGAVTGVDPHPGMLAVARAAAPAGARIEWRQASAEHLPLDDGSFHAALCSLAYQFFTDKPQALREMHRVLTPGGRVVIHTPGPTPQLFEVLDGVLAQHIGPEASAFVHAVFSVDDPAQVRMQLDEAGFDDVHVETGSATVQLPPAADFFWQYMTSTPLAAIAEELDPGARAALEHDVVQRCERFASREGLLMEVAGVIASARCPA